MRVGRRVVVEDVPGDRRPVRLEVDGDVIDQGRDVAHLAERVALDVDALCELITVRAGEVRDDDRTDPGVFLEEAPLNPDVVVMCSPKPDHRVALCGRRSVTADARRRRIIRVAVDREPFEANRLEIRRPEEDCEVCGLEPRADAEVPAVAAVGSERRYVEERQLQSRTSRRNVRRLQVVRPGDVMGRLKTCRRASGGRRESLANRQAVVRRLDGVARIRVPLEIGVEVVGVAAGAEPSRVHIGHVREYDGASRGDREDLLILRRVD